MDRSRVAIVIPALNEAETIAVVVEGAKNYGIPIVVDDGSSDDTVALAKLAGAVVVSHKCNLGYDTALNAGFRIAAELNSELVITIDADGQHDPKIISKFLEAIDLGADVVVGIRDHRQRFAEHIFAWYAGVCFGIKDPLCGMKAYKREIYDTLGHFDACGSVGTELMMFAAKRKYRVYQIPINVRERGGSSRFGQVIRGNFKIFRAFLFAVLINR